MGQDKALLRFGGRPMVEIAWRSCGVLCGGEIAGNREDLSGFAPVVREERVECGPAAGWRRVEGCKQPWAMFVPVDVPLVPAELLRLWCEEALRGGMSVSYLGAAERWGSSRRFVFCSGSGLHRSAGLLDGGERRLEVLLNRSASERWIRLHGCMTSGDLYGNGPSYQGPDEATLERDGLRM
jgi:molybdopterin-guanine dinucleotide biosynthesis protein A